MPPPFAHLAAVSCYSLRDGVIRPTELAAAVADRGMDAVGVCDRDGLLGAVRLAQACADAGVRPIFGADLALRPDPARPGWEDRRAGRAPAVGPAWLEPDPARVRLIARTRRGYAHLCRAISDAHLGDHSERGRPQLDREALQRWIGEAAGELLVLLGDDSPVGRLLDAGRSDAACTEARRWMELVGRPGVLVGVTHHRARGGDELGGGGPCDDDARARTRFALADHLGLRAVADQRPRYLDPSDAALADVADAVRGQVPLAARHSRRRNAEGFLKSPEQMAAVFTERPDALAAAAEVAEACEVDLELGRLRVPDYADTGGLPPEVALRHRSEAGLGERYAVVTAAHRDRLEVELAMIARLGLAPYFLTVAQIVDRIRAKQIAVACRGSAAGSLVAHCLGISDVDPIRHDLCFERFANPYRDELPDIDLDVESARREAIERDLIEVYGADRVVCVAMVETFKARMAIREVGKALGLPAGEVDVIAKAFPHVRAGDVRAALEHLPELRGVNLARPDTRQLFDLVERMDGLPRHVALHPSGVLLGDAGLRDLVACQRSGHGLAMAQLDKDDVEALGLCKLDVLGVRMLSSLRHALDEVARVRGVELEPDQIPVDDEATYELIRTTRTLGMFQIESPGQRELVGKLQPASLADLVVDISLFRPGPVKGDMIGPFLRRHHGREPGPALPPALERALGETHGVIVYHEQVMRCVAALTGCDLATADLVRRRLGDPEQVPRLRDWVLAGASERGVDPGVAEALWEALAQFASFGFCKAHAAAFAVPTARSAWMKAHHLPEFVAGLLTHDPGMYPRRLLLADARQLGVCVLPLDVNASDEVYRVERVPADVAWARLGVRGDVAPRGWRREPPTGRWRPPSGIDGGADPDDPARRFGVRLGLADVTGIDAAMIESLRLGRPFTSIADVRERARLDAPVAEALAHVGALDSVAAPKQSRRDVLLEVCERWGSSARHGSGRRPGRRETPEQPSLLEPDGPPGLGDYRPSEQVRAELEVLGLDASRHVISFYDGLLDALGVVRAVDLLAACGVGALAGGEQRTGRRVRVAGAKVATQTPPVRSGQRVIFLSLDDGTGVADAAFFESVHEACAHTVFHCWLLLVEGRAHRSGPRGVSITADRAWDLRQLMHAWREGRLDETMAAAPPRRSVDPGDRPPGSAAAAEPGRPVYDTVRLAQARRRDGASPRKLWHASGGSAGR